MKLAGLVEHQLLKPLGEGDKKRWLFVTNELEELLRGESDSSFPSAGADNIIARFCKGLIVSVSRKATSVTADFKWLQDHDQAWVLILDEPRPGWRMFGRFARKNVFVGLSCLPRHDCAPWQMYQQRATDMISDWQSRFPVEPLRSNRYNDYFSDPFWDKDAP